MQVELRYGRGVLPVRLPDSVELTVVRKPDMPLLPDARAVFQGALGPLAAQARGKKSACILVCDLTRPVPNGVLLRPMIETLRAAGVDSIVVLVATGLHRPNLGAELREVIGDPWVFEQARVENHDARDDAAHVEAGVTRAGTRVRLDRRFVEADVRVVTGLVEPHFMAGWSGGRKVIAPGVAHRETITTLHSARIMAHPLADNCVLEGNPLHREQLEIAAMVQPVLAANVVVDEGRRISFVNFGEVIESHAEAVRFVERYVRVPLPHAFRTVVTSGAGHPLDRTYYQTVKGMVAPLAILEPGGTLIVASECAEGMGSKDYVAAQQRLLQLGPEGFARSIEPKRFADIDEWQTQMQLKPLRRGEVLLYTTGLRGEDRALTGVRLAESVEQAVLESVRRSGDSRVAIIPEGPYVVPFVGTAVARGP